MRPSFHFFKSRIDGLVTCQCGANMDGDSGFYRCQDRCGNRGIKKETLEKAVTDFLFNHFLSKESLLQLQDEINTLIKKSKQNKPQRSTQIEKEIASIEKQTSDLITMVQQLKHQRPILEKIDQLEEERVELVSMLEKVKSEEKPVLTKLTDSMIQSFLKNYKKQFQAADIEKKKGILRTMIDSSVLDRDSLKINPSYECITGVKMVLPRGFEPLLPA